MNDITQRDTYRGGLQAGLHDEAFVSEYGRIETIRASRYNTSFSVVLADISGAGTDVPAPAGASDHSFDLTASAVLETVRGCDVVGMTGDGRIAVILPETDYFGSLVTIRKLARAVGQAASAQDQPSVIFSQATFPQDGRVYADLLACARSRAYEKRDSAWERLGLRNRIFWEVVGELASGAFKDRDNASFDAGTGQVLSEFFMDQINELILKEIARNQQKRGIMYLASRKVSSLMPAARFLSAAAAFTTKVFLVGEADESAWDIKNATPIVIDDPRFRETFFTFYLGEGSGYALICRENWGGIYSCFHTSDTTLVEGLITKFQTEYSLQEQLG